MPLKSTHVGLRLKNTEMSVDWMRAGRLKEELEGLSEFDPRRLEIEAELARMDETIVDEEVDI